MDRANITVAGDGETKPRAHISCRGSKVLLYIFLAYYVFKICYALLMLIIVSSGYADIRCEIVGSAWRIYFDGPDWFRGYNSFPTEWAPGMTVIENPLLCNNLLVVLGLLTEILPVFLILMAIRKLLYQIKPGISPFTKTSVRAIRFVGIVFIYKGVFSQLILQLGMSVAVFHRIFMANPYNLSYIFAGLMIFIVAKIFEYGCQLQEESDQII
ncbi:MAG: DUF2975 domain-containing protein [Eubacteriales bacterium]|nr:DUF2975 domain-containing protein [Eubacteriales bacterium]